MKGLDRNKLRGNITIEASFILPIIIFLVWNLLFLAFYLHDQSLAMEGSYMTALRTERLVGGIERKERIAQTKLEQDLDKRLAASDVQSRKKISKKDVEIETEVQMDAPAAVFFQSSWKGSQYQKADAFWPVDFIRNCRKAEDIKEYIKKKTGE